MAESIIELMERGIGAGIFSAAASIIVTMDGSIEVDVRGRVSFETDSPPVTADTLFDVASLTKPFATSVIALKAVDDGKVRLDEHAASYLPAAPRWFSTITLRHLLTHTSGLPAIPASETGGWLEGAIQTPPSSRAGTEWRYSDTGYIVLQSILQNVFQNSLDKLWSKWPGTQIDDESACFAPGPHAACVSTGTPHRGRVHDPRAAGMGGVAGHAGLFMSAIGVATYMRRLLSQSLDFLTPAAALLLFTEQFSEVPAYQTCGFFVRGNPLYPDVRGWSIKAVAHSGFTGCFLILDPSQLRGAALLTNRVLAGEDNSRYLVLRREWMSAAARATLKRPDDDSMSGT